MKKVSLTFSLLSLLMLAKAQIVDRYVNIQSPTQTSVIIAWNSAAAYTGTVNWGTSSMELNNVITESGNNQVHAITISGLQPNTQYFYQASGAGFLSSVQNFFTAKPDSVRQLSFVAFGDCGFSSSEQDQISALMAAQPVDFGILEGDVDQYFGDDYDGNYFSHYVPTLADKCYFTAIGNHDTLTNQTNYLNAFHLPHNNPDSTGLYYSFTWGNAKVIALDGDIDYTQGSDQYNWLVSQLQCNNSEWVFVFYHQPAWTNGWDVSYYIPFQTFYLYQGNTDERTSLIPLFEQYKVDFVINGHAHDYQSGVYNGVHYLISGGGGTPDPDNITTNANAPNYQFIESINNYMMFSVNGDAVHYNAYDLNNNIIDSLTVSKTFTPYKVGFAVTDPKCNGFKDGSAVINVTGPRPSYTYQWNTGSADSMLTSLGAGDYTVTVTDSTGCTTLASVTVGQPQVITASSSVTDINCNGNSNGAISVNASGGTSPYIYSWNTGDTVNSLANLGAGVYTLTITDLNGCTDTVSATIKQPTLLSDSVTVTNASCYGSSNGAITIKGIGGTAPYKYLWSNIDTNATMSNLRSGKYYVTVTDANKCFVAETITVQQPQPFTDSASVINVNCNSDNNGAIDLTIYGGTAPYTYLWNTGETTSDISSLRSGNYTADIKDMNGCRDTIKVTVTAQSNLSDNINGTKILCSNDSAGSASLTVSGGTSPYSYIWSTGDTSSSLAGLAGGVYYVTITDASQCSIRDSAIIMQSQLVVQDSVANVTCHGISNGSIEVTVTGGYAPYTYLWNNGHTTAILNNISGGQYSVIIKDNNGCKDTTNATVTEPALIADTIRAPETLCNGDSSGSVTLTVSGGKAPYTYYWNTGATTQNLIQVPSGAYTVTITDGDGCNKYDGTVILRTVISVQGSVQNETCPGDMNGSIQLTANGGTPPYQYTWANNINPDSLTAGIYNVTVADPTNCSTSQSYTIRDLGGASAVLESNDSLICGDSVKIYATLRYQGYIWNTGAQTSFIYAHTAGMYYLQAIDSFGCSVNSDTLNLSLDSSAPMAQVTYTDTGLTVHFIVSPGGANHYYWYFGNGQTATDTSARENYIYPAAGPYKAFVIAEYPCGNDTVYTTFNLTDTTSGIAYLIGNTKFSLTPNPFHTTAILTLDHPVDETLRIMMHDMEGRLLRDYGDVGGNTLAIEKGDLAAGIYLLHVTNAHVNATLKLVIE